MTSPIYGLVLTPGAGSDRSHAQLLAIEHALPDVAVMRMDFPYRIAGRRAPDRMPVLEDAMRDAVTRFARRRKIDPQHVVLGGRSMGGRVASRLVAARFPAAGLVLVSYPFHPPGKPDSLRVEHFREITVPTLFVSGDRDAFGSVGERRRYIRRIRGPVVNRTVRKKDHALSNSEDVVARLVAGWMARFTEPGNSDLHAAH